MVWSALLAGTPIRAATPARDAIDVRVDYDAPSECPSARDFERLIAARSARIRIGGDTPELEVRVRIERSWWARIELEAAHATSSVREVTGETCRETATAAALIVAVLADPDLPHETPAVPPASEPTTRPTRSQPSRTAPARAEPLEPWTPQVAFGVQLVLELGPAPDALIAPRPFVALEQRPEVADFRAAARLSVARGSSETIVSESGQATLIWTAARLEGCAAIGDDDGPSSQSCAMLDAGTLRGRGSATRNPKDETALWLAPGVIERGAWGLAGVLRIELQVGLVFPLRRYRYFFAADETVHEVPVVGASAGLGIAAIL
jgi:hypothetical protein